MIATYGYLVNQIMSEEGKIAVGYILERAPVMDSSSLMIHVILCDKRSVKS